jgi:hypothetical protein
MAQDLWEIVEQPPNLLTKIHQKRKNKNNLSKEGDEATSKAWRKKNSMALNVL